MSKNIIRLTESDIHKIVKESVNMVLNELNLDQFKKSKMFNSDKPKGFYICIETMYGYGDSAWIGNEKDAKMVERSSEGNAIGPFRTHSEALKQAYRRGIKLKM